MENGTFIIVGVALVLLVVFAFVYVRRRTGHDHAETTAPAGRLAKTAAALGSSLRGAWASGLSQSAWEEIEEALIAADVGVENSQRIVANVRSADAQTPDEARVALADALKAELGRDDRQLNVAGNPGIVLVVGVNGTGKTTTIAKLAKLLTGDDKIVVLAAADTFRAAAGEQLRTWGDRVGVSVVQGQEGGDPASVAHDAISSAKAKNADVVLVDTAGRLHGKKNLMAELSKIHRVCSSEATVAEVLLVLDATAGQNGVAQVREFGKTVPLSGLVLTKLDGTAKGGIAISVERELDVPVKFVGLGEGMDDLEPFDPGSFVDAMLEQA